MRHLGKIEPTQLAEARLQIHWASQVLGAVGAALGERREDDSHTALLWSDSELVTQPVLNGVSLALDFGRLSFALRKGGDLVVELSLEGKTLQMAFDWASEQLKRVGAPSDFELSKPSYDMPDHPVANAGVFNANPEQLRELAEWYSVASEVLLEVVAKTSGASPVRCWPHHFDLATLIVLERGASAEDMKSVGVGLSPGDGSYAEPYFYVTPWPYPEERVTPELVAGGSWHTEGFYAAILRGSTLATAGTSAEQRARLEQFIEVALQRCTQISVQR